MTKPWVFPCVLFTLAAALRAAYVLLLREHPTFDAPMMDAAYHYDWAQSLAAGEEFQDGPFFRAPLYPVFLGLLVKLFGASSAAGVAGSTLGVRLAQSVLGGLTAVLTYRLGRRGFGESVGRVSGVLVAMSWVLVAFDAELLIPTLFLPLLLLALERLLWWGGENSPGRAFIVGAAFGLAAIARPNILALMPVLFAWTLWRNRKQKGPRRPSALGAAAALTFGTLLPIAPLTIHNALEGDRALVATQAGVNFWIGNNPSSDGATAIVPGTPDGWWEGYYGAIAQAEQAEGRELLPSEVSSHYLGRAVRWMASDPGAAAAGLFRKLRLLVGSEEIANNQDIEFTAMRTMPALRWSPVRWDVLLGLGAVGFYLALRSQVARDSKAGKALLGYLVVYGSTIVLFFVNARFRTPLIPVMAVGAAYALVGAFRAARAGNLRLGLMVVAPAILIAALSHWIVPAGVSRGDVSGLMGLGQAELRRGDTAAALAHLESAHRLSPSNPQVCFQLASALDQMGADPRRAIAIVDGAIVGSQSIGAQAALAADLGPLRLQLRLKLGDAPAVLREAETQLTETPANSKLRFVHGAALAQVGRLPEAIAAFREQARDEPMNAEPLYVLGQIFESQGRPDEARSAYRGALARGRSMAPMIRDDIDRRIKALVK